MFIHVYIIKLIKICNLKKNLLLSSNSRFAGAFALRQRMLNFVQNIQYYMMFEVMEPTWHIMENNLKSVTRRRFI